MSKKAVRKLSAFLATVIATLSVVSLSGAQITAKAETVNPTRLSMVSFVTKDPNCGIGKAIKTASGYVGVGAAFKKQPFIALLDKEGNETSSYIDSEVTGKAETTGLSDVIQTSDGGYLAVGYNEGTGLIYKMDANLHLVWKKTISDSMLNCITKTDDGHYLTGFRSNFYKIDENGTVDATITLDTRFLEDLDIYKIIPTADGYFAAGCVTESENGIFAKYGKNGALIWSKNVSNVSFSDMTKDSQGHYVLAGTSASGVDVEGCSTKNQGAQDAILACFDSDGNRLWVSDYGSPYTDGFDSVEADGDNLFASGFGNFDNTVDQDFGMKFTDPKVTSPVQPSSPSSGSGTAVSTKSVSGTSSQGVTKATFSTADINALGANDTVQVALGGTTIQLPASVLKNFAGSGFSVSTSSPDKATSSHLLEVMGSNKDLVAAFNFDAQTSSGSAIHQLGANVKIMVSLTDDMMAKIRQLPGVKLFYYNPETNTLEDMHATFNLNSKTITFTTSHFSTYVIASSTVRTSANPQTGDSQNAFAYVTLLFVAASGAVYFLMHKKSTKKC